ncbi:MAG: peptidoglycan editing factor PgeF [Bacilli bacterium]|nr:peptidoglycan editing factor PgeF [Bacilli bacterium]
MNSGINNIELFGEEIVSLFISKPFDFYRNNNSEDEINKQIEKVEKEIGILFKKVLRPYQTHSNNVMIVDNKNINDDFLNVDGLITNLKGVALCTSLADCQGIILYDQKNRVIGNIHSGWKGTLSRICTNAVKIMKEKFNSKEEDIIVYISPCIHKCCFEVDEDLKNEFEEEFSDIDLKSIFKRGDIKDKKQKYYIDTVEINKRVLLNLGIKEENIHVSELCSMCNSDTIHSFRKDKPNDGRNLLLIALKNN